MTSLIPMRSRDIFVFGKAKIPALSLQTAQGQGRATRPKGWATRPAGMVLEGEH